MNKIYKIIISGIITLSIGYFSYVFITSIKNRHSFSWEANQNLWLFRNSAKNDIDPYARFSYIGKDDVFCNYIYKKRFYISIWEFKYLNSTNVNKIKINSYVDLSTFKLKNGEILNDDSSPEILIEYGAKLDIIDVNLDLLSKIDTTFDSEKYKGFYGKINKLSFSNSEGINCILFDFPSGKQPVLFLLYRTRGNLYIIMVDSDNPFDPNSLIDIFNLN